MSYLKPKMHQLLFRLGLCPRSCWGSLQHLQPPAGFKGGYFYGKEGIEERGEKGWGIEKREGEMKKA